MAKIAILLAVIIALYFLIIFYLDSLRHDTAQETMSIWGLTKELVWRIFSRLGADNPMIIYIALLILIVYVTQIHRVVMNTQHSLRQQIETTRALGNMLSTVMKQEWSDAWYNYIRSFSKAADL